MASSVMPNFEWMTVAEAAEYLRLSRATIYRWAQQGKLQLYKVGGTATRVRKCDLEALAHPQAPWTQLSAVAFDADWDNPKDAIYDDWKQLYDLPKR